MSATIADDFGFYAILTNPVRGYEYLARTCVELAVPFVQLRMKETGDYRILRMAEKLRVITENTATRLIINDSPAVAKDAGADGVHLGRDDMAYAQARELLGPGVIIGLSTHTPEQTEEACKNEPDYIGIGPVYATPTKKVPDPVIGIDGMKKMLDAATVPAVCIGGITLERLPEVLAAGARNFCMVRAVCDAADPAAVLRKIEALRRDCLCP